MQGLDSTTTTNRLAMLRLGNTTTMDDDSNGTVIFSDPCSCCGSMKRLRSSSSPLQEDSPPPRNKKILIESPSFSSINTVSVSPPPSKIHHSDHLQPTNPFLRSNPNSSFTTSTSPSLQSLPFIRTSPNSVPFTLSENSSDINNNVNSVSCFNSKSSSVPVIRRCNSVPLTTSENSSEINNNVNYLPSTTSPPVVSFSNPKSPENFGLSTLTPPSKPVTYLDRLNSFSSSCGSQKSAVQESPVMTPPSKPPRPSSLYRSFSDVNPCVTPASTLNSDEMTTLTASGSPVISDGDNPSSRRWKRMRKSLVEMNKWLNYIIQEQSKEDDADADAAAAAAADDDGDGDDEGEEKKIDNDQVQQVHETIAEENVTAERDGDAMKVRYVCSCGKHYQIAMSI